MWSVDIEKGDRIAQIMFVKKEEVEIEEVNEFDDKTEIQKVLVQLA